MDFSSLSQLSANPRWVRLLRNRQVLVDAAKVSLVVGTLLNLVNQWEPLSAGQWPVQWPVFTGTLLNYLIPFGVSLFSSIKALSSAVANNEGDIQ